MITNKEKTDNGQEVITVEITFDDFKKYFDRAAENMSKDMKIEGFRPGKVPFDVLRARVGDMIILEEAARLLIMKEADDILNQETSAVIVGQPRISITKLVYGEPLEYKIAADLLPEAKLANYKGRGLKMEKAEVTEAEIEKILADLADSRVKEVSVDREIKMTDKAIIDIKMFLDNVPVDGGQSKGVAIILGKDYIIPGFDKELVGLKNNETKEFSLVFPADHYQKNLAGKKVEFVVDVKNIFEREIPEINDEFAKTFDIDTLEEMKKNILENVKQEKISKNKDKVELELLETLIKETEFGPIPESLIKGEKELMIRELRHNVEMYGGKFEDYLLSIKKTVDGLLEEFIPEAIKRVKSAIIMRRIIEAEGIKPTEEKIDHEVKHLLEHYGNNAEAVKKIKTPAYRTELANNLAIHMGVDKLHEWNIEGFEPHDHECGDDCDHEH